MLEQTAPTVFSFESTVNIRMVMIDQRPYFVAQDVCSALEIQSVDVALRKVDSDEKGTYSIRTPGGYQSLSVVNESGLYWLMLRCRKAAVEGTIRLSPKFLTSSTPRQPCTESEAITPERSHEV
ncbi:BRO-N domain-containing protein, partial [Klebsiella pneumoniae]|uniref:BRO-N domain-containing protein n=2 Tax=Klebsiella pneumoniae TaxID=573 RepID=UPI002165D299